jgi:hypothetical protein
MHWTAARNRRRRRLRATAVPTLRPIEKASRGGTTWASATYRHHKDSLRPWRPSRVNRSNARRSLTRAIFKPTTGCGLSAGEP